MRNSWRRVLLSEAADLKGGFAFRSEDYAPAGRFVLRTLNIREDGSISHDDAVYLPTDLCQQYSRFELRANDTLFVMVGATLGKIGLVKQNDLPALLNQNMWLIRAKAGVSDPTFVHYAFRLAAKSTLNWASGSARDFVRREDYRNLAINLAPIEEQRALGHVFGTIDNKIELNRRMNETLEAMARAIFKSWFVDFDPVRAKAASRQPFGMEAETAALFARSFVDSQLGKIPKGWRTAHIGDVVTVLGGSTPSTEEPEFWGGSNAFATPKDMSSLRSPVLVQTERQITTEGLEEISSGLLPKGTVLLSSRAPIGYLAIAELPVAVNQGIIAMVCDRELPSLYVLEWTRENLETIIANANGTTFLEISKANFRPIEVLVPPRLVLNAFVGLVEPVFRRIIANVRESVTLESIRDTLLPKLVSGEIRIKDAEKMVGEKV